MQQNPYAAPSAGYAPPQGGAQAGSTENYEFNAVENETIAKLAKRARIWGVVSAIGGALACLGSLGGTLAAGVGMTSIPDKDVATLMGVFVLGGLIALAWSAARLVIGLRYISAGKNLDLVVTTEGNDVALAVDATENMGKAFWLDFWMQIALFGLVFIGVIVMIGAVAALA